MGVEIERKFLVDFKGMVVADSSYYIKQGYILNTPEKVVRVRLQGEDSAFLTVKGKNVGMTRPEFEYSISRNSGITMLETMCSDVIEKTRYIRKIKEDIWEIDVFHGDNKGLVVAEIELQNEDDIVIMPEWIGKEVTDDARYYNNNLATHPYKDWE